MVIAIGRIMTVTPIAPMMSLLITMLTPAWLAIAVHVRVVLVCKKENHRKVFLSMLKLAILASAAIKKKIRDIYSEEEKRTKCVFHYLSVVVVCRWHSLICHHCAVDSSRRSYSCYSRDSLTYCAIAYTCHSRWWWASYAHRCNHRYDASR